MERPGGFELGWPLWIPATVLVLVASPPAGPCLMGRSPPLERVPDQVGLIAQAKLSHEICSVALDGADADR